MVKPVDLFKFPLIKKDVFHVPHIESFYREKMIDFSKVAESMRPRIEFEPLDFQIRQNPLINNLNIIQLLEPKPLITLRRVATAVVSLAALYISYKHFFR